MFRLANSPLVIGLFIKAQSKLQKLTFARLQTVKFALLHECLLNEVNIRSYFYACYIYIGVWLVLVNQPTVRSYA